MPAFDSKLKLSALRSADSRRDNIWLLSRLDYLWSTYFSEMTQDNPIFIQFGRYSQFRLGSIKFDPRTKKSVITITSMFKDQSIPVEVVDHTIGHELCHYSQGFSSPKPKKQKFPHSGGVIQRELEDRNLHHLVQAYKAWVKSYRNQLKKRTRLDMKITYSRFLPRLLQNQISLWPDTISSSHNTKPVAENIHMRTPGVQLQISQSKDVLFLEAIWRIQSDL